MVGGKAPHDQPNPYILHHMAQASSATSPPPHFAQASPLKSRRPQTCHGLHGSSISPLGSAVFQAGATSIRPTMIERRSHAPRHKLIRPPSRRLQIEADVFSRRRTLSLTVYAKHGCVTDWVLGLHINDYILMAASM